MTWRLLGVTGELVLFDAEPFVMARQPTVLVRSLRHSAVTRIRACPQATPRTPRRRRRAWFSLWTEHIGRTPPIEPAELAKLLGVDVFEVALGRELSGALVLKPGSDPTILLERGDSANRKRFTCAHELGHYVKRVGEGKAEAEFEYVDFRSPASSSGVDPDEVYANSFAAELLMPESLVRAIWEAQPVPALMAAHFGVSGEAMGHRLKYLRLAG